MWVASVALCDRRPRVDFRYASLATGLASRCNMSFGPVADSPFAANDVLFDHQIGAWKDGLRHLRHLQCAISSTRRLHRPQQKQSLGQSLRG
jgi:hypothetical protein